MILGNMDFFTAIRLGRYKVMYILDWKQQFNDILVVAKDRTKHSRSSQRITFENLVSTTSEQHVT